jgi:hypothetical protein
VLSKTKGTALVQVPAAPSVQRLQGRLFTMEQHPSFCTQVKCLLLLKTATNIAAMCHDVLHAMQLQGY